MTKAWMPLYIGDYLGDTTHLTQGQHGAYLLMIMHYWVRGSLPADKKQCYSIAHAMDMQSRSNADAVLKHFFVLKDGTYRHPRIDKELKLAAESYERRASAAKTRWSKEKQKQSNAYALHEQSQSHINTYSGKGGDTIHSSKGKPPSPLQADFDERDLRNLAKAKQVVAQRAEANVGSGSFTEAEFMTAVCEEAGLTPQRVKKLEEMTKWKS